MPLRCGSCVLRWLHNSIGVLELISLHRPWARTGTADGLGEVVSLVLAHTIHWMACSPQNLRVNAHRLALIRCVSQTAVSWLAFTNVFSDCLGIHAAVAAYDGIPGTGWTVPQWIGVLLQRLRGAAGVLVWRWRVWNGVVEKSLVRCLFYRCAVVVPQTR